MSISFSIIIPTYNREAILPKALDSVLSQTYPYWECIIVDDHSTDNTIAMLESYVARDNRIKVTTNTHRKGAPGARNTGLEMAQFDWVIFFDSDNYMYPSLLEVLNSSMESGEDVFVWFSRVIDANSGKVVSFFEPKCTQNVLNDIWTEKCYIDTNNAVIRKSKLLEIDGWDEFCPSMQEWDLHLRLSRIVSYCSIPQVLVDYFVGTCGAISSNYKRGARSRLYLFKKFKSDWIEKTEAGILNYQNVLAMAKKNDVFSYSVRCRFLLIKVAPYLSWIFYKRQIKRIFLKTHR